jgi:hypothetical protein
MRLLVAFGRPIVAGAVVAAAVGAAPFAHGAPATTERSVRIAEARFGFDGPGRIAVRIDFDRAPARLEQVVVGIHVMDPVRAGAGVRGRRFTGGLPVARRANGEEQWVAGRTYPLLVVFCPRRRESDGTPRATAAKGGCTWIRSRILLRRNV